MRYDGNKSFLYYIRSDIGYILQHLHVSNIGRSNIVNSGFYQIGLEIDERLNFSIFLFIFFLNIKKIRI